ncbi:hypothetical protein JKP88DRAFT_230781 [Tribonema minus]|uniref:Uncharacterized protein n=1 Tax=Tribonema minus TaxID=303371 RepID=A0A836CNF8_9STRA|nr:hypothetical protein JKP88DRAFT_230781 [Tribonema minus]
MGTPAIRLFQGAHLPGDTGRGVAEAPSNCHYRNHCRQWRHQRRRRRLSQQSGNPGHTRSIPDVVDTKKPGMLSACVHTEAAVQQLGGSWRPGKMEGGKANFQKAFASWRTGRSQGEIPGCGGDTWRVEGAASLLCSTDGVRCAGVCKGV